MVPSCGFEHLKLRTTSGDVYIENVTVKEMDAETISGDMTIWLAEDAAVSNAVLRTASGDVEAHAAAAGMKAVATSGDLKLDVEVEQL